MIQDRVSSYPFAVLTDAGLVRPSNEDRYAITAFHTEEEKATPGILAVLSDGVGGESGGEVAAGLAVESIMREVYAAPSNDPTEVLPEAIRTANEIILSKEIEHPSLEGMAATIACAWISGRTLHIATLGDSRIYLLRNPDQIVQLSTDHTWVQEAIDSGVIHPEEKENHPRAHVIRRFLGSENPPEADMRVHLPDSSKLDSLDLLPGDIIFLCTDGCSDLVNPQEIRQHFTGQKLEKSLEEIKKQAFDRGGRDNITMIAIQVPARLAPIRKPGRSITLILATLAVLLAIALGLYLGWKNETLPVGGTSTADFTPQQFSSTLTPVSNTPLPLTGMQPQITLQPIKH
jgi:protein phosphatase